MKYCIIADLHLGSNIAAFQHFCENIAPSYNEIYILGDLFNLYLGDDLIATQYSHIASLLHTLTRTTKVYIMRGNRDFLLGKKFAIQTGVTLIDEPFVINTTHKNYVLLHGDSLVTADKNYQRFKKIIQHPWTKKILLSLPQQFRTAIAIHIQKKSQQSKQQKSLTIMDIDSTTLHDFMDNYPNYNIIHGHTHRQNIHTYDRFKRFVLGDWSNNSGNFFAIDNTAITYHEFNI
jgi:UDP-2,3-diacylglucosamine hydrolase